MWIANGATTIHKTDAPQFDVGPSGTVLNIHRLRPGTDEPVASFTPRSLDQHAHSTLQVSVLLRGSIAGVGWHSAGGKAAGRRVRGGQAYIVPPDQPHDFKLYRPEGMVNFHIDRDALVALDPARLETRPILVHELAVVADPLMAGLAEGIHEACRDPDGLTSLYLDATWTMLAVHLVRRLGSADEPRGERCTQLPGVRLSRAIEYMHARLGDGNLRVCDVAVVTGLSPVHFTRLFTRTMGTSPMQFVIGLRLDRARDLLRTDAMSITAIALATGFGSHARFSEAFRRRFGLTPSEARSVRAPAAR